MSNTGKTKGQHQRALLNVVISVLGAAAILVAVNYLSLRHYATADWTADGLFTLSPKSLEVLGALEKDVNVYLVWSKGDTKYYSRLKGILDRYAAASKRVKLEAVDPDVSQDRLTLLVSQYGAKITDLGGGAMAMESMVIVVSGDNVKFVGSSDLEELSGAGLGEEEPQETNGFKAEQALTSAILHVTSDRQSKVCFTEGHDERAFAGFAPDSLGHIQEALQQDGLKAESIATQGQSRIPQTCDAVVVAGPGRAFLEDEAALLAAFVDKGGKLLLLLDPVLEEGRIAPTGLEKLCADRGIKLGADILIEADPRRLLPRQSNLTFLASEFTSHAAVKHLALPSGSSPDQQAYPVLFALARSLAIKDDAKVIAEPLAKTSVDSWGETDLAAFEAGAAPATKDSTDTPGPVVLAMASAIPGADGKTRGELVVVGDSDFLSQELFINGALANRDLWSALIGHLTARPELVSIAPKDPKAQSLALSEEDLRSIELALIAAVLVFIVLGVVVYARRRR